MKAMTLLLFTVLIAVSSNSFSRSASPFAIQPSTFTESKQFGDTIIVPAMIRTSFLNRYPAATNVVWYKYTPGTMVADKSNWYYTMDTSDYYVSFFFDNSDHVAWFDNGQWLRSSRKIDNTELPASVNAAIKSQYPGFIITDVDLETDKSQTVYEVDLEKGDKKWVIHYGANGQVLKSKSRDINRAEPVTAMVSDFETRYPSASSVTWYRYSPRESVEILPTDWDYSLDASDYEVRFVSDGTDYVAWYDNGTWLRSEATNYDMSKLPSVVNQAISRDYAGYMIKDVDREEGVNQVLYEVEIEKTGGDKCKIHYSTDGTIVKKKCRIAGMKTKG